MKIDKTELLFELHCKRGLESIRKQGLVQDHKTGAVYAVPRRCDLCGSNACSVDGVEHVIYLCNSIYMTAEGRFSYRWETDCQRIALRNQNKLLKRKVKALERFIKFSNWLDNPHED